MDIHKDQQWRPPNLLVKQLSEVCETEVHKSNHPPRVCYAPRGTFIWIGRVSEHPVIPDDTLKPDWVPLQDDVFQGGNNSAGQPGLKHTLVRFESPHPSGSKSNRQPNGKVLERSHLTTVQDDNASRILIQEGGQSSPRSEMLGN